MELRDLRGNVENHFDEAQKLGRTEWALSCNAIPGLTADEIATLAKRPNPRVSVSSTDALADLGLTAIPDNPPNPKGHSNIYFDHNPTSDELLAVKAVFQSGLMNVGQPKPEYKS